MRSSASRFISSAYTRWGGPPGHLATRPTALQVASGKHESAVAHGAAPSPFPDPGWLVTARAHLRRRSRSRACRQSRALPRGGTFSPPHSLFLPPSLPLILLTSLPLSLSLSPPPALPPSLSIYLSLCLSVCLSLCLALCLCSSPSRTQTASPPFPYPSSRPWPVFGYHAAAFTRLGRHTGPRPDRGLHGWAGKGSGDCSW